MKRTLALFVISIIASFLLPTIISAYSADPSSGTYEEDTTLTLELKAAPQNSENAVSVNLKAEGMTVTNYNPPSGGDWLGSTSDCTNGQKYTSSTVCTSMAKTTPIVAGESLGTVTILVKGKSQGKLIKTDLNAYAAGLGEGTSVRNDTGDLAVYNEQYPLVPIVDSTGETPSENNDNLTNSPIQGNTNLALPLVVGVVIVVIVLLIAGFAISNNRKKQVVSNQM